jgi:predicted RNA methylase
VVRVSALPRFLTEEDLMSGNIPAGGLAVMQSRRDPVDSLDFFPTPPWATRALCEIVLPELRMPIKGACVWEPACGAGHMAEVLKEYALMVWASDVHAYPGYETALGSFVGEGPDVIAAPPAGHDGCADRFDWIITNPPFGWKGARASIAFSAQPIGLTRSRNSANEFRWSRGVGTLKRQRRQAIAG